jgi:hypothetical protein
VNWYGTSMMGVLSIRNPLKGCEYIKLLVRVLLAVCCARITHALVLY